MRIGLTFDLQTDPCDERQAEFDPPRTIEALTQAFTALGHEVVLLGSVHVLLTDPRQLDGVALVFNIAEGRHGRCREAWVSTLLELYGTAYVGSDPLALSLGLDKATSKRLAVSSGILTPRWITIDHPRLLPGEIPLDFPVIVKPRYEGSGIGIDEGAVVYDHQTLAQRVRWLFKRWEEPLVIEEFIAYGELTVCVIGNDPPAAYPAIQRPVDRTSRLSVHVARAMTGEWEAPLELTQELDSEARRVAVVMFEALGCRDIARIDLRVDEHGRVYFLEINPLPSFDPEGTIGLLAEHLGMTYTQLIGRLLEAAQLRVASASAKVGI